MTEEQKAKELIDTFRESISLQNTKYNQVGEHPVDLKFMALAAKDCAAICVNQIIAEYKSLEKQFNGPFAQREYWQRILKIIEA